MKPNFFSNRRNHLRRRGSAMVETAFVVVILLGLSLGLIQWAVIFNASISLTNLSREGARYAAVHYSQDDSDKAIRKYIKDNVPPNINKKDVKVTILPSKEKRESGQAIHVIIDYDMGKKLFLPSEIFAAPHTITFFSGNYRAEGQMMMEPTT